MEKVSALNLYVACLRSLYLLETHFHWQTRGKSFYGDHLLFDRLQKSAAEDADTAAERFIGLFGKECVSMKEQSKFIATLLDKYTTEGEDFHALALKMEKDILAYADQLYDFLDKEGLLTLGLENDLPEISAHRETACYLLQQALDSNSDE
jgi:DNA-binding ferritin-like protein